MGDELGEGAEDEAYDGIYGGASAGIGGGASDRAGAVLNKESQGCPWPFSGEDGGLGEACYYYLLRR